MSLTAESDFLVEIKKQYERDLYFRQDLDKKANVMIYFSAAIFAFLVLLTLIQTLHPQVYTCFILIVSIVLTVTSMVFFMYSSFIRKFHFPYGHDIFFYKNIFDSNKTLDMLDENVVKKFRNATKGQFSEHQINQYLKTMRKNVDELESKAYYMKIGFPLLMISVIGLGVSTIAIIYQFLS